MGRTRQRSQLTRRGFLAGATSLAFLPKFSLADMPAEPDVVIVGAGAAGLSAARTLLSAGKSVIVLEALTRIGGRAWTESETFGVPFDHGCSWITSADANPFKATADEMGFTTVSHDDVDEAVFVGGRRANEMELEQYWRAYDAVEDALAAAGTAGIDVAASTVVPDRLFSAMSQTWIVADMAVDFADLSTKDYWFGADSEPTYLVREGFGTLVARMGSDLPVSLGTPVTRIDWGGNGVSVDTPSGSIRAKACIVTASTGVLNADVIRFNPPLPAWKRQAIADVPMGLLAKIALQFDGARLGFRANEWLSYYVPEKLPAEACYFVTWPTDLDLMIGFVGGKFAWELSAAEEDTAVDFALEEVVRMVGSKAREHFTKGILTKWANDPWTRGAYSAALPGRADSRSELARPIDDRLFFAGEAQAGIYYATCGGAWLSGEQVARTLVATLG